MKKHEKKIKAGVATAYGSFEIVLAREPDMGGYMVTVPNVPAAITWGKSVAHAKEMAREAIELSLETKTLISAAREGRIKFTKKVLSSIRSAVLA